MANYYYPRIRNRYTDDFSFTHPVSRNFGDTKYLQILKCIATYGAMTKADIVFKIWGKTKNDFNWSYRFCGETYSGNNFRGWHSKTFGCMASAELIKYNSSTRKWELAKNAENVLRQAKCDEIAFTIDAVKNVNVM